MNAYNDFNILANKLNNNENQLFTKRQLFYNDLDEMEITKEKNNEKLSLRKKKHNEFLNQVRKDKLKRMELFCKTNNSINYDELIKQIPVEVITEFNNTKNKNEFYLNYLSLSNIKDPNFYLRMFAIYQIHNFVNNDINNTSLPSPELFNYLLKYFVYEYTNENINQKIKIQNEILEMLIIWESYKEDDNTNSVLYEDQFIFFLFDLIENNIYSVEFKIKILILLNKMIKGINTFNKIIQRYEIINKIEKVFVKITEDEQYIFVLSLIDNIFIYFGDNYENINNNFNNNKIIIFLNSYDKFILLLNNFYEKYDSRFKVLKNDKASFSMDKLIRTYYKIIIRLIKILNDSTFLEESNFYISKIISSDIALPLFYKILETFSQEFFYFPNNNLNQIIDNKIHINNNTHIQAYSSNKYKEKNNLYKKFKVLWYITHILNEVISNTQEREKGIKLSSNNCDINFKYIIKFNFIQYYSNLLKNFEITNIQINKNVILRIEELIYNFCEVKRENYKIVYQNYDLIRELLAINLKYYNKNNFKILLKFIILSLELYDTEISSCLIFNINIIGNFIKYLEKEKENYKEKDKTKNICYIFYALKIILDSETYRKCKLNRNLIFLEFNKNNATEIILQYTTLELDINDYILINKVLSLLDESDMLDEKELEDIYNPSEI